MDGLVETMEMDENKWKIVWGWMEDKMKRNTGCGADGREVAGVY